MTQMGRPNRAQILRRAVRQLEWGADIRVTKAWQIDLLRQIISGQQKQSAPTPTSRPAK